MARGAEGTHIVSIVNGFKKIGHEVFVVSPPGIETTKVAGDRPLDKSQVKTSGINSLWKILSSQAPQFCFELFEIAYNAYAILKLSLEILRKRPIALLYERNANFLFAGAVVSMIFNVPLFIEVNEVAGLKRARPLCFKKTAEKIEAFTFSKATTLFAVSSYLQKLILTRTPHADVRVLPNAIDPARFLTADPAEVKARYHLDGKTVLGFVGWFDRWDRLDMLIDLQKQLVSHNYNTVLMLVGDGPVVSSLREKINMENLERHVIMTGPVPKKEVANFIAAVDIGIFAHSNEFGSPIALFEMMAMGVCVIAPRLDPILDVVQDGVNGVVFNTLDAYDLYDKTSRILDNAAEIKKIGTRAKEMVFSNYTWDKNAAAILSAIS